MGGHGRVKTGRVIDNYTGMPIEDLHWLEETCPRCSGQMIYFDGGDQGGVPFKYCSECEHEIR